MYENNKNNYTNINACMSEDGIALQRIENIKSENACRK